MTGPLLIPLHTFSPRTNDERYQHDNKNGPCKCGATHTSDHFSAYDKSRTLKLKPSAFIVTEVGSAVSRPLWNWTRNRLKHLLETPVPPGPE